MSIKIGNYTFDGPYSSTASLYDRSGVYAVLDVQAHNTYVLDVGESANVKTRVENHDRADAWKRNAKGNVTIAVLYTQNAQQAGRMQIEQELRQQFQPPCGKR